MTNFKFFTDYWNLITVTILGRVLEPLAYMLIYVPPLETKKQLKLTNYSLFQFIVSRSCRDFHVSNVTVVFIFATYFSIILQFTCTSYTVACIQNRSIQEDEHFTS